MLYSISIDIPAQTSRTTPLISTLAISQGIVTKGWLRWRYGSGNLGGVRVFYHETQIWPFSLNEWLPSSQHPLEFPSSLSIPEPPYTFSIHTYNDDDVFPHSVWLAFEIERGKNLGVLTRLIEWAKFE